MVIYYSVYETKAKYQFALRVVLSQVVHPQNYIEVFLDSS